MSLLLLLAVGMLQVHAQGDDIPLVPVEFAAVVRLRWKKNRFLSLSLSVSVSVSL
jgi:hypothetical protein